MSGMTPEERDARDKFAAAVAPAFLKEAMRESRVLSDFGISGVMDDPFEEAADGAFCFAEQMIVRRRDESFVEGL